MAERPNFIIFYTDDQGYGDLSCMGSTDLATPHLDGLAESGALLRSWYSNSPVCSPSRASVLTGRYPGHAGVRSILGGHRQATGLPTSTPSLASILGAEGYRTGMFGKWHLGVAEEYQPHHHGFDEWKGFLAGCIDYYSHIFYWGMNAGGMAQVHDLWDNGSEIYDNGRYFTEMIGEWAVDYVDRMAGGDDPFFLYVPFNAPHYPMHAPERYMKRFDHLPWERQVMAAMLAAVDDSVGAVVEALERHGLRDDTCIFFQSDNGPSRETRNWLNDNREPYYGGTAGPLKGHKFSLYEGGIRMPALMSFPGRIPEGQVIDETGAAMDVLPTFLASAGIDPSEYDLDGRDVMPMLAEEADSPHEDIFWEQGDQTAVRRGPWKLVLNGQLVEGAPPEDEVHLSNVVEDIGETRNLAQAEPELTADLRESAEAWRAGVEDHWQARYASNGPGTAHHA
ncbi:MAG: sulfatase-like hydrolase/transferase [Armatimonadia bacterium]|nr:sulfatase-like hydrolase/transferase [Armatimonadia bacterium]